MDEENLHRAILGQLGAIQQDEKQRDGQEAGLRELAEWLKRQKSEFTEYDDTITRRYVERITVVDAETIRIRSRYTAAGNHENFCCSTSARDELSGGFCQADALTDFLGEVAQRCKFKYHFFGHYYMDRVIQK